MPPRLPLEITDLILDELGARPREECLSSLIACCTTSKAFVEPSQKRIFHSVTLYSPFAETPWLPELIQRSGKKLAHTSSLFVRTIAHKPHLRSYVREFTYALISPEIGDILPEAVEPLQQLPNLECLCLRGNLERIRETRITDALAKCIASMFCHLPIKAFDLSGIMDFKLDLHTLPTSIEQLHLTRSSLNMARSVSARHPDAASNLKTLICDEQSLRDCINPYLRGTGGQGDKSGAYSHLEKLDFNMSLVDPRCYDTLHRAILGEVECLKELTLTCAMDESYPSPWRGDSSPLKGLNPSSFSSLTCLTFDANLVVERLDPWSYSEDYVAINIPYMGLCNPPFSDLCELQSLHVNIVIEGGVSRADEQSFGRHWGKLCDTLTAPGAFPKLSKVTLAIDVRAPADSPAIRYARVVKRLIFDLVYPDQFQRLIELDYEGTLRFSFEAEVTEVPTS